MNRADLIDGIRDRLGVDKRTAENAVDAVLERFREWAAEADGARIEIGEDGTLTIRPPLP